MIAFQFLVLVQMEQLHLLVPALKSMSASKRTAPQWQLPVYIFFIRKPPELQSYHDRIDRQKVSAYFQPQLCMEAIGIPESTIAIRRGAVLPTIFPNRQAAVEPLRE